MKSGYHNERYPWGNDSRGIGDEWVAWLCVIAFFALIIWLSITC